MTREENESAAQSEGGSGEIIFSDREFYPRKQLERTKWTSLNGPWQFAFDDLGRWQVPTEVPEWTHTIRVPFAPEAKSSGIGDPGFHLRCWYRRTLAWKKGPGKLLLHFGAVDYEARVWVNGHFVGQHQGGHTPFYFDITHALTAGEEQEIVVRADDDPQDLAKPRGKQDWLLEPHNIWYSRTSGIWQTVWLEEVPPLYIEHICWTPLLERWEIGCEVFLAGALAERVRLRVRLTANDQLLADDTYGVINQEVHRRIALSDPGIDDFRNELLWSPEKPTLIHAELELLDADGNVLDHVKSYTALRSVAVQRGRFLLNGRPYTMRLVLDQGYWRDSLMTAPDAGAFRRDVELVKAAGFNGVRKHQKIEDPAFLYWADVLGLLVWGEMPSAYRFTHESVERITREWTEVIDRDSNHPCIAVWVPFNESWGVPDLAEKVAHQSCVQAMYHLTRTLDSTRPVIGNDGWESTATDILGIHDYDDDPDRLKKKYATGEKLGDILKRRWPGGRMLTVEGYPHDNQPAMLTEFGGIACIDPEKKKGEKWGYSVCDNADDFKLLYQNLLAAVHRIEFFIGFCYTQFTDTFQEANGLFTMDRQPKFPLSAMARSTRGFGYNRGELVSIPQPPPILDEDEPERPVHV